MSAGKVIAGLGFGIAIGTAFGFYALAPNVEGGPSGSAAAVQQELSDEKAARTVAEQEAEVSDEVLDSIADLAVRNRLAEKSVAVFHTGDAPEGAVDGVKELVEKAGGTVAGEVTLEDKILSADHGDELKSIAANSLPAGARLSEDNLNPGMHAGQLLAAAVGAGDKAASESDRAVVMGALGKDGYISVVGDAPADSDLAVIITGDSSGDAETGNYGTQFLSDFAAGMDSTMGGVVLAGERGSADAEGAVGMIRADKDAKEDVSTVDNVGSVAGQVTVIRALQQQGEDRAGHYGTAPNAAAGTIE
ncbi:MAG TPA: copper transporter [Candidatus Corynebacterium gallistercoris]|uniref:Copper transporter n=1 Tax=Candidatus Corynebacterium gallistercoris TaxID=2838530 RepID=A0A9D1RXR3_9CORY|nr:copper transporter [Candidatus Corynebacterium gallistercoris]